jgi:hypothetical protein
MSVVRRLLVAAYFVEAGLLLIVAPWSASWQHNYFGARFPVLGTLMLNLFVRGAISGIGVVTVAGGLREVSAAISGRRTMQTQPSSSSRGLP